MRYILNSAVVTSPGDYRYTLLTVDEARSWVSDGPYLSTMGYQETAELAQEILGAPVPMNRVMIRMEPGDEALVVRINLPPGSPRLNPRDKGRLREVLRQQQIEIGLLKRTA